MARHDLSQFDASSHAASELEYIIQSKRPADKKSTEKKVSVSDAMHQARVRETHSNRDVTRVLFVSQDTELLNPTQQSLDGYLHISELFAEVHILILRRGIAPKDPVLRVAPNVWLYTAAAPRWWQIPQKGISLAVEQLQFAAGFRPDLIVARDPFESALVAYMLGKRFARPTQLHILEDYTAAQSKKDPSYSFVRRYLPRFLIPKFTSVRTKTTQLHSKLCERFSIKDCAVLPRFQNYRDILSRTDALDLAHLHAPISFFMLYVGELTRDSSLFSVMQAAQEVLKNRRVGLIVLGDGVARQELETQAKTLGIHEQVIFKPNISDPVPYLLGGHLLFATDTDAASESVVLQGAAAGVPMLMARTHLRNDLFTHQSSTYFCDPADIVSISAGIGLLLEHVKIREHFAAAGKRIISEEFHANPQEYLEAYRATIEAAFFTEEPISTS